MNIQLKLFSIEHMNAAIKLAVKGEIAANEIIRKSVVLADVQKDRRAITTFMKSDAYKTGLKMFIQ